MSGTVNGRINCRVNPAEPWQAIQEIFVTIYDGLTDHANAGMGPVQLIASNYGNPSVTAGYTNPGAVGTGMKYWDDDAPCGEGAFFVFEFKPNGSRTHSWYVMFEWVRGYTQGGSGLGLPAASLPLAFTGSDFVPTDGQFSMIGLSCAVGDDGGDNYSPWGGSTRADGTDTKGEVVWSNGATVAAFPRCNGTGGAGTLTQFLALLDARSAGEAGDARSPTRFEIYYDDDNMVFYGDRGDSGNFGSGFLGPYTPVSGLTVPVPFAFAMVPFNLPLRLNGITYGPSTGSPYQGGVVTTRINIGSRNLSLVNVYDTFFSAANTPTNETDPPKNPCYPILLATYEDGVCNGQLGTFISPMMREVSRCMSLDQNSANTRRVYGWNADVAAIKPIGLWDGVTVFGENATRAGVPMSIPF